MNRSSPDHEEANLIKIEVKSFNDVGLIIESLSDGIIGIGELMQVVQDGSVSPDNQNKIGGMLQVIGLVISSAAKVQSIAAVKMTAKELGN